MPQKRLVTRTGQCPPWYVHLIRSESGLKNDSKRADAAQLDYCTSHFEFQLGHAWRDGARRGEQEDRCSNGHIWGVSRCSL
jgi:hypothetical protein